MFVQVFYKQQDNTFTFMFINDDDVHMADVIRCDDRIIIEIDPLHDDTEEAAYVKRFAADPVRVINECESCLHDAEEYDFVDEFRGRRLYASDISDLSDTVLV